MPDERMMDALLYIATYAEAHDRLPPTQAEIAQGLGISPRTVRRCLEDAEQAGLLCIRRHANGRMVARGFELVLRDSRSSQPPTK